MSSCCAGRLRLCNTHKMPAVFLLPRVGGWDRKLKEAKWGSAGLRPRFFAHLARHQAGLSRVSARQCVKTGGLTPAVCRWTGIEMRLNHSGRSVLQTIPGDLKLLAFVSARGCDVRCICLGTNPSCYRCGCSGIYSSEPEPLATSGLSEEQKRVRRQDGALEARRQRDRYLSESKRDRDFAQGLETLCIACLRAPRHVGPYCKTCIQFPYKLSRKP
jgi:hypothetical protein